jgi:ubiquinone/menaquinone biosynthesis C-methylase UbiE
MILERITGKVKRLLRRGEAGPANGSDKQALDIYWDPAMAEVLETWGEGNAWSEIQLLLATARGRVLDIACGTGKVMSILANFPQLELEGCDISDFLIEKAVARGIDRQALKVCDATHTGYEDKRFDYSYSIGSLEHFTEEGILAFLTEARRITKCASFHQIPVSRRADEGWISPYQSYFNNGVDWWLPKFRSVFPEVSVLPSNWYDDRSVGKWFLCQ